MWRRATYSMWFDVWRRRKMPVSQVFCSGIRFWEERRKLYLQTFRSPGYILHHITNICQKRDFWSHVEIESDLNPPISNFFSGANAFGFSWERGRMSSRSFLNFGVTAFDRRYLVSFHPTGAHAQIRITVYTTCTHICFYIYITYISNCIKPCTT